MFNEVQVLFVAILSACVFSPISSKGLTARISPKSYKAFWNDYAIFKCFVNGNPTPKVTWYNNGKDITSDQRSTITKITGGYVIRFGKLHPLIHNGTISCKASNSVDSPSSDTATISVLRKIYNPSDPSLPAGYPKPIAQYDLNIHVVVGTDITLIVNVTGDPTPKITWFRDGHYLDWSNPRFTLKDNSLHIANAQLSDIGRYDYMAENDKGRIFSRPWSVTTFIQQTKPVFVKGLENKIVDPQTDVQLNCTATGYPKPKTEWQDSRVNQIVRNGPILVILNILHTETYKCTAYNDAGTETIHVKVTVREVPLAPVNVVAGSKTFHSLTISWQEGNSSKTVDSHIIEYRKKEHMYWITVSNIPGDVTSWKIDQLDAYTDYDVRVFSTNSLGTSKGSSIVTLRTDETVPGSAPRDVLVKATGYSTFEVSWKPPALPNGDLTSYKIYYTDEPNKPYEDWKTVAARQSPFTVHSGLNPNRRYAVAISASTGTGSGPVSKSYLVQTLKGAPSDPQYVQAKVVSSTSVKVSWSKPIYNGGGQGIVGYELHYNLSLDDFGIKENVQSPDDFSKTITGLRPYTTYKFAVAAKTDAGSGPVSFAKIVTTTEDAPSGAPTNITCIAIAYDKIRCKWNPPAFHTRNGKIIGYRIRYKSTRQNSLKNVAGSLLSLTIDGLEAYTAYDIDIAAKTNLGYGPSSNKATVTTDERKPYKAPVNVKAKVINSTAIYMTWQAPSSPFGGKLLGYVVYYRPYLVETNMKSLEILGAKQDILIGRLSPETDYELRVALRSGKGIGLVSDALFVKTKQPPPNAPILKFTKLPAPQLGVNLSWTSDAEEIQKFRLRYAKEVERVDNFTLLRELPYVEKNLTKSVTKYTYTNFEHGLWYLIKLSVENPGGWSVERQIWVQMDAAKPTGAPLNLKVEPTSSTSLQISWDLPSKWRRNGEIVGYKISYSRAGQSSRRFEKHVGKERTFHLGDLSTFTAYRIWIRAKTVAGEGPDAEIQGKTKQAAPSTPPIVTEAKGMGTDVVLLRFRPPSKPNGVVTGYKARIYLRQPDQEVQPFRSEEIHEDATEMYIGKLIQSSHKLWFKIAAKTIAGFGPYSPPVSATMLTYDLPLPIRKLSVRVTGADEVKLTWVKPVSTAAVLTYQISYAGMKTFRGEDKKLTTVKLEPIIKTVECCKENSAELKSLEPNTKYVVNVSSADSSRESEITGISFKTKVASSPGFSTPSVDQSGITKEYIPVYLSAASERNGAISHYLVYVAHLGSTASKARQKLEEIKAGNSRSRREVQNNGNQKKYITAKLLPEDLPTVFKIGHGQDVNGYENKQLTPEHFYAFSVESCVLDENSKCLTTMTEFTDVILFTQDAQRNAMTDARSDQGSSGFKLWLLGPVGAVLLLMIVIVIICILWRRRVRSRHNRPHSTKLMIHDEEAQMLASPKDPVDSHRLNLKTEGMRSHPPIHISDLADHVDELHANNNNLFTREYESIDTGMTFLSEVSAHHLNQSKNRYPNIVPYDHTRVILQGTNGFLDSDYINANVVAGYRNQNAYIATQAPLSNTINDFWQMIWEQGTRTIVMMTNLKEKGRIKCDQYWPKEASEKFGFVSVTVLETVELAHYTIRTFRLCKDGNFDQSREVKHFQYTAWPEHGVPYYSTSLLCFIRKVKLANPSDVGPIVVHCSAGVGRTAVFIVVDSMLERIRREQTVDIYGHVTLLRSQRNHMVQTEDQYIFIHETLLEAVRFGNTDIQASDLSVYFKKLNEIGEAETTNIEEHFKLLSNHNKPHRIVTGALPVNKLKNRYPKFLPYEHSRVDLVPVRGTDGSNYINASYIDGYKQRRTYIAAQGPLDQTINDFWRMVMEKKSNIIVMLSGTKENDKAMPVEYWPTEKSAKYHFYIVDPVSVEETPNFTLRQFKVNDMMGACPSLIKLFQLRQWPERGTPQACKGILDLIGQVHTARNNDEGKGPVVVHCSSGSGRTGVFCALSIVVERMRAEGLVDLLQTVRQLREQRPEMVETLEQYSFCYETALHYLSSFDHIA